MADGVELATAYISIVPEGSKIAPEVRKQFGGVGKEATRAGKESGKKFGSAFGSGLKLLGGAALGGGLISFLKDSNDEAREAQKVGAQTAAVIKSTGKAANLSANQFGNLATAISLKTGIDDEQIQAGENMLATFTNIRDGVGKNNKIFTQATKVSTDLAVATKTGPVAANVLLGKALNDPAKGLSRLTKIGVTFTDQQKAQVTQMAKVGDTAGAQRVILKELTKEFGGSAAAQATAGDKLNVAFKNLEEQVGTALLPVIDKTATKLTKDVIPAVSGFITGIEDGTGAGGKFADAVKTEVLPVVKSLGGEAKTLYNGLHPVFDLLMSLPAPVKTAGISVGVLSSQFAKFGPQLPATATGLQKVQGGLRSVAGGGGLLLLANSAGQSSKALGGLEGAAGGAALGLAVGGPLGAAVGGVAGGLLGVFSSGHKAATGLDLAAEAAKQGEPTFSDYASTLDQVSGATTRATKAAIIQDLQQKGLLDTTRQLGISDAEVVKGLTGGTNARLKLKNDLAQATTQTEFFSDASEKSKVATLHNVQALQGLSGGLQKSQLQLLQSNLLTAENKRQADRARSALEQYGKTHAVGTAELYGYTTVKKQAADLKATLTNLFNFAAKGEKAHPELNNHGTSLGDALGLDLLKPKHKAIGGPVTAGTPYLVGERRPELFIPNSNGRIVPRPTASGGISSEGQRVAMTVTNWQDGTGYFETVADSRVDSAAAMRGETDRAL